MIRDIIILCVVFVTVPLAVVVWLMIDRAQRREQSQQRGFEVINKGQSDENRDQRG